MYHRRWTRGVGARDMNVCTVKGGLASSPQQYDVVRDEDGICRPGGGNDRCSAEPGHHVELRAQEPLTEVTADMEGPVRYGAYGPAPGGVDAVLVANPWLREPRRQRAVFKNPVG